MKKTEMKKLKRKPKWKLSKEQNELYLEQKKLRKETNALRSKLEELKTDIIEAYKTNDADKIAELDAKIQNIEEKISKNERRYKDTAEVLEVYSKILKNNREGESVKLTSIVGSVTGLIGAGLGAYGLTRAYESDKEGGLIYKKVLESTRNLPIIRNIGGIFGKK